MADHSYFYNLRPKFQVLGHVPTQSVHGSSAPTAGFDLNDPEAVYSSLGAKGPVLGSTNVPADSPLYQMFLARDAGNDTVVVGGNTWRAMPLAETDAWTEFQKSASPSLTDAFGEWISAGKTNDVPLNILATHVPATLTSGLDSGVSLFACSVANDDGTRPGTVPSNFWATSLIYLVNPASGVIETPSALAAGEEYQLAAIVGNRGNNHGGRYAPDAEPAIEVAAWVMVWNSGMSPAVQLPSLGNLDKNDTNGVYEIYHLPAGAYELAGFRMVIQTVFDGLVKAIDDSGTDLGGLTATQWVHSSGAHLCVKVLIRQNGEAWPTLGDTPFTDKRFAQKNLVAFDPAVVVVDSDPDIVWRNFMLGDAIMLLARMSGFDDRIGRHEFVLRADGVAAGFKLFLAFPRDTYKRWFNRDSMRGLRLVGEADAEILKSPFPKGVVFALDGNVGRFTLPPLGEQFLAASLGIMFSKKALRDGERGRIELNQTTADLVLDVEKLCYSAEPKQVSGWTMDVHVGAGKVRPDDDCEDPNQQPRRIRVILESVIVKDDGDAFGSGELWFESDVGVDGKTVATRIPPKGYLVASDQIDNNVLNLNCTLYEGVIGDKLVIGVKGYDQDCIGPDDSLGNYSRIFTGPARRWLGVHQSGDEAVDSEDVGRWSIRCRIEVA